MGWLSLILPALKTAGAKFGGKGLFWIIGIALVLFILWQVDGLRQDRDTAILNNSKLEQALETEKESLSYLQESMWELEESHTKSKKFAKWQAQMRGNINEATQKSIEEDKNMAAWAGGDLPFVIVGGGLLRQGAGQNSTQGGVNKSASNLP